MAQINTVKASDTIQTLTKQVNETITKTNKIDAEAGEKVNKTGDTMTGPLRISGRMLSTEFAADNWSFINHLTGVGGWARGIVTVLDNDRKKYMEIGAHGWGQRFSRMYFGREWDNFAMEIFPDTKRTNFVGTLTKEGKAIATEEYVDNKLPGKFTWGDLKG